MQQTNRQDMVKLVYHPQETKPATIYEPPLDSTEASKVNQYKSFKGSRTQQAKTPQVQIKQMGKLSQSKVMKKATTGVDENQSSQTNSPLLPPKNSSLLSPDVQRRGTQAIKLSLI